MAEEPTRLEAVPHQPDQQARPTQPQAPTPLKPQPVAGISALITAACALIGAVIYIATFSRAPGGSPVPHIFGALVTLLMMLPPLWICRIKSNAWAGLVPSLWRFGAFVPALVLMQMFEGAERKYYILTLLTCYFASLPLESRALIRMAQNQASESN